MYHYNQPVVSYPGQDREAIEKNKLLEEQNLQLLEQNKHLQKLADETYKVSVSAEKSAKSSKICTILSLIIAVLMLIATSVGVGFDIWSNLQKEPTSQQATQELKEYWQKRQQKWQPATFLPIRYNNL